jgi:2-polyprenyl-6-methoxyphenol hydroxylase-like FAD-dependent oxidoreductase
MAALKPMTIIGGGLAGLALGIGLRQRGVPVIIFEAGHYPRHRVCGEFVSGNGQQVLARLGLRELFDRAGAFQAQTAAFIASANHSPVRALPEPALCLSRYSMDALLAKKFQELGGELRNPTRWSENESLEGVVRASGRHAQPTENGWRWFGLKAHVRNVKLAADLEMHISSTGYVGVNRINNGEVNVCGLFRARKNGGANLQVCPTSRMELLRGKPGSPLHERLANATFDETSFCSVAGLSLQPRRATEKKECCIGDALTMIPPVTGNGMSMAFESAELAMEPLTAFSRNEMSWTETQQTIARICDHAFASRLAWARWLQWLMFSPVLRSRIGVVLLRSDLLWRMLFTRTR